VLNNLRNRIVVEVDGKLMTGRDVAVAALRAPRNSALPRRRCDAGLRHDAHLQSGPCPLASPTSNPSFGKFLRQAGDVVNFMYFIARELRE
jgi:glutamate synthase (ferredoxin)